MNSITKNNLVSVVVPVYNSQKTLEKLYERTVKVIQNLKMDYEFVFVNDGSTDNSWNVLRKLQEKDQRVVVMNLMKNFGQHNALLCGFQEVKGDYIVTIDDDLQTPPEDIKLLYDYLLEHPNQDVVIGVPANPNKTFIRKLGSNFLNRMISAILKKPKHIRMASFRMFRYGLIKELRQNKLKKPTIGAMIYFYTRNVGNVEVMNDKREHGRSGYSLRGAFKMFKNFLINYSRIPLRLMTYLGFLVALAGFIIAIIIVTRYFTIGIAIEGWTSLMCLSLLVNGIILLSLGVIGEYLFRIVGEVNSTPQYVIKDKIDNR